MASITHRVIVEFTTDDEWEHPSRWDWKDLLDVDAAKYVAGEVVETATPQQKSAVTAITATQLAKASASRVAEAQWRALVKHPRAWVDIQAGDILEINGSVRPRWCAGMMVRVLYRNPKSVKVEWVIKPSRSSRLSDSDKFSLPLALVRYSR